MMQAVRSAFAAIVLLAAAAPALAQTPDQTPPAEPTSAVAPGAPASIRLPAGTAVQVELTEALSSETSQQEQLFGLRLAEPIIVDGREVVPAGVAGGGEVIDAAPSAFGGRQGRLIISGRYIEIGGQRARIRGMQLSAVGEDRANTALAAGIVVGLPALFIQGGEIEIPVGARGTARLAADVDVALEAVAAPAAAPALQAHQGENQQ